MSDLPPNIVAERRTDLGSRKLFEKLQQHERDSKERFELFQEGIEAQLEHLVSYKVLIASVFSVAVAIVAGVLALTSATKSQVEDSRRATDAKIEKLDTALQGFKAETGAEVKGMYRFLLEKQPSAVVKRQVEEEKRENAPPPPVQNITPHAPPVRR